jgi:2-phospho-L-lactate guanylyltransferase
MTDSPTPTPVVIIPVKPLDQAKSRLAPHLDPQQRKRLTFNLLREALRATQEASLETWVVATDDAVRRLAAAHAALWKTDPGPDLNTTLHLIFRAAWDTHKAPLFLPGDLPYVKKRDLDMLISSSPHLNTAVLVPAQRSGGTNAIFLPQPTAFQFMMGKASFRKHVAQAASIPLPFTINYSLGLTLDLDTWEDAQEYDSLTPGLIHRLTSSEPSS